MNVIKSSLYSKLTTGTALMAKLAGATSVYDAVAPRGASLPYVVFHWQGGGDENITPTRFKNVLYTVKGISETSAKNAGEIDSEIDALLHGTTLTDVTGWTNFWCMRETDVDFVETTPEGQNIWHQGGTYRIRLNE